MLNLILNDNNFEPTDYKDRLTARTLILNDDGDALLLPSGLIGGGVEENESLEQALHREALEEAGAQIEIIKEMGEVVCYRDFLKRKYVIHVYLAKYIKQISNPTDPEHQNKKIAVWENINEGIIRLENEIEKIKKNEQGLYKEDNYQGKIFNRQVSLFFLKEYLKTK